MGLRYNFEYIRNDISQMIYHILPSSSTPLSSSCHRHYHYDYYERKPPEMFQLQNCGIRGRSWPCNNLKIGWNLWFLDISPSLHTVLLRLLSETLDYCLIGTIFRNTLLLSTFAMSVICNPSFVIEYNCLPSYFTATSLFLWNILEFGTTYVSYLYLS